MTESVNGTTVPNSLVAPIYSSASLEASAPEDPAHAPSHLTSARLLASNVLWNIMGIVAPVLVAVICLPILKRVLGTEKLGVISLVWVVVGYFSMFDFGISRALTKLVAENLGQKRLENIAPLVWTSLALLGGVGIASALLTCWLTPWIVEHLVKVPSSLHHETVVAFYWLCSSIPFLLITAGFRGILEALQRFRLATAIKIPMGIFAYAGPVVLLPFSHSLAMITATLVLGRGVACMAHVWAGFHAMPGLKHRLSFQVSALGPLVRFGTWMTVSNVVAPFMVTFDRFVLAALVSISAVAYYAVPYEAVTKITLIPTALIGVLFPAFSTAGAQDRNRLALLCDAGIRYLFILLFPLTLAVFTFAPNVLRLWLGNDFALNSTAVVRWLVLAVFVNSLAQIPFAHLQSAGRPDITAKLHLSELPFYAILLFAMAHKFGVSGVAFAWMLRVLVDAILLFFFSHRHLPENKIVFPKLPLLLAAALSIFFISAIPELWLIKLLLVCTLGAIETAIAWRWLLNDRERMTVSARVRRLTPIS